MEFFFCAIVLIASLGVLAGLLVTITEMFRGWGSKRVKKVRG